MVEKKELNLEDLESVNGGYTDDTFGHSYSSTESESIPAGTRVIYTDTWDDYKPHYATYVRYAGSGFIVLKPDDAECKNFFEELNKSDGSYVNVPVDGGTAYEIIYTWVSHNHLYKA